MFHRGQRQDGTGGSDAFSGAPSIDLRRLRRVDLIELLVSDMDTIEDLRAKLLGAETSLSEANETLDRLKQRLDEKDAQIEHLKDRLDIKDRIIADLQEAPEDAPGRVIDSYQPTVLARRSPQPQPAPKRAQQATTTRPAERKPSLQVAEQAERKLQPTLAQPARPPRPPQEPERVRPAAVAPDAMRAGDREGKAPVTPEKARGRDEREAASQHPKRTRTVPRRAKLESARWADAKETPGQTGEVWA